MSASHCLCLFDLSNRLFLEKDAEGLLDSPFWAGSLEALRRERDERAGFPELHAIGSVASVELFFATLAGVSDEAFRLEPSWRPLSLLRLLQAIEDGRVAPRLAAFVPTIRQHVIEIPYLYSKESDFIYRFRADKQRNRRVYHIDTDSETLYHSALCEAIKAVKRGKERTAASPATLNFGAVEYTLPSHFGFCLGVQNAIERAYETIAENPSKRVYMLSELIHNPFVNEDLRARGLCYLQTDKGVPVSDGAGVPHWDKLSEDDIVVIPAFGARDEDKVKLIERGLELNRHDATCMLVEKVWKAARRYGKRGYTVVIHGKAEHEETKATFSNSAKYAPSLIIRDLKEAKDLAAIILSESAEERRERFQVFQDRSTPGFDPTIQLEKLAFVNQTTLLRNETVEIIDFLAGALESKYGQAALPEHLEMSSKGDTLCYATQVNQDALAQALEKEMDVALVVGGKNSSNTYQLFRLCQKRYGPRAFYIQSERNILSASEIEHFVFPYNPNDPRQGRFETLPFLPERRPLRVLLTGGASCPDGLLQQIVSRINGFFPPAEIRSVDEVLDEIA